jgi:protein TonB
MVDVVVLSSDMVLYDAIRSAIGERNPVWRARSAEESVDLLVTGRCGVLLLDLAAVSTEPAALVEQISEQFPDVVVVVAGRREDEPLLAQLISDGLIYRFMHKPLTATRASMFLQAAIRWHVERRESRTAQPLLALTEVFPARLDARKWLFVATGLALFAGLAWLVAGNRPQQSASDAPAAPPASLPAAGPVAPRADPVLSRARAAFAAGRYEAPAGRNALDLYAAVLFSNPTQPEARAGLDRTIAHLVSQAEAAAAAGNRAEAERLLERIQAADPGNPAAAWLATVLEPRPTPVPAGSGAVKAAATRAATPTAGNPAPGTTPGGPPSSPALDPQSASRAAAKPAVTADPLVPRYTNADEMRAAKQRGAGNRGVRSFGAPISSGLPIAGYVNAPAPQPVAAESTAKATAAGGVVALTMPADDDRVIAADPVYPASALRNRVEGWVELEFTITETGAVRDIEVVDAQPRGVFESAAAEAVGQWRYRPSLANGQPAQRRSTATLRFSLDD